MAGSSVRGPERQSSRSLMFTFSVRTAMPAPALRETFVVVASRQPLDLKDLGRRAGDPQFYHNDRRTEPDPYTPEEEKEVYESRSRDITLTDDYAPVENLLAPVAETRGED